LQKLFPAPGLGPAYVRACLGPLPFLRIVPTSGVDEANAAAFLAAGAHAVGFVNPLFDPAEIAAGRFDLTEQRARRLLRSVRVGDSGGDVPE
jgi:2-dehydro-3-deoxyphosphogluconate aldolase/(4S)-4-hydroxy-2-oxoglutarate aldolase